MISESKQMIEPGTVWWLQRPMIGLRGLTRDLVQITVVAVYYVWGQRHIWGNVRTWNGNCWSDDRWCSIHDRYNLDCAVLAYGGEL